VCVLDYEMSNLRSATKALERLGARVGVAARPDGAAGADALVLPGVGNFGQAMRRLREHGFVDLLRERAAEGVPVLGICLGLQLLFDSSEESPGVEGLGILAGPVRRLVTDRKVPHIGWSVVDWAPGAPVGPGPGAPEALSTYYFVHSFAPEPTDPADVLGTAEHGVRFCAAAGRGNVAGVQFHPEKSSRAGLALLERWLAAVPRATARVVPA
jgi:glutamine amidotransferase